MHAKRAPQAGRRLGVMVSLVLVALVPGGCLGGCVPTPTPTPGPPTSAVVVGAADYWVLHDYDKAWATFSTDLNQYTQLTSTSWQSLLQNARVTTDADGQAQLCPGVTGNTCPPSACHIYVWQATKVGFDRFCCPESGWGTTICACQGAGAFLACPVTVVTLTAAAKGLTTWYSVIYLWDSQITLVIAGEGTVQVTPITVLEPDPPPLPLAAPGPEAPPPPTDYKPDQWFLDTDQTYTVTVQPPGDKSAFYYTAPDKKLKQLEDEGLLAGAPPPRQWDPMDQLPDLRARLLDAEPQLEVWLGDVSQQAVKDGIKLPGLEPLARPNPGLVITGYGGVVDQRFADALGFAVDWQDLSATVVGTYQPVRLDGVDPGRGQFNLRPDLRSYDYSPDQAQKLFAEAGYAGYSLALVVPPADRLRETADRIVAALTALQLDMKVEIIPVPEIGTAEADAIIRSLAAEGRPFLTLTLR
jgi:ABC-type transport system substrate-binding protein